MFNWISEEELASSASVSRNKRTRDRRDKTATSKCRFLYSNDGHDEHTGTLETTN